MYLRAMRYVLTAVIGMLSLGSAYLLYAFIRSGMFGADVLGMLTAGFLMLVASTVASVPLVGGRIKQKAEISPLTYWVLVSGAVLVALLVIYLGLGMGSMDYTHQMAQQS
jgi:hypothetical protein